MSRAYRQVAVELQRQDDKWDQRDHVPAFWMNILMEEVGETAQAVVEHDLEKFRCELIQVAAVAINAIESLDRAALRGAE